VTPVPAGQIGLPAQPEYRLHPGDVIAVTVAGFPDLSLQAEVQIDGNLSLPRVGEVASAGRTIAEVRSEIRRALSSRILATVLSDGSETVRAVDPDQIAVAVTSYRPVYVAGDVARPGELTFRPGMTVRQAIAGAGGAALAPMAPMQDPAVLRTDYIEAWYVLADAEVRVWSLQSDDQERADFNRSVLPCGPADPGVLDRLLEAEAEVRALRLQGRSAERTFLDRSIAQIDERTKVLSQQLDVQRQAEEEDNVALAVANDGSKKGLYTAARLSDIRNAALLSATRRLQTEAELMRLRQQRLEFGHDRDRLEDQARLERLSALEEAQLKLAQQRARLAAAAARVQAAGLAPSMGIPEGVTRIAITRDGIGTTQSAPDAQLLPGDVLDVTFAAALARPGPQGATVGCPGGT